MPVLNRHTKLESDRLRSGWTGVAGGWIIQTSATGTTHDDRVVAGVTTVMHGYDVATGNRYYSCWDVNAGCPHETVAVYAVQAILGSVGAGDTLVVRHISTAGVANNITDTANCALFAVDNQIDFADIHYYTGAYATITKGENIQLVTTSDALAVVSVGFVIAA